MERAPMHVLQTMIHACQESMEKDGYHVVCAIAELTGRNSSTLCFKDHMSFTKANDAALPPSPVLIVCAYEH